MSSGRVVILGAGVMGSAFTFPVADAGTEVHLVGTHLDEAWIADARQHLPHPRLGVPLPESVHCHRHVELSGVLRGAALLVIAVSSPGIPWVLTVLREVLRERVPLLLLTKGMALHEDRIAVFPELVARALSRLDPWYAGAGGEGRVVGGLGGPCIAAELAARRQTRVAIAPASPWFLGRVGSLLDAPYYHVTWSDDLVGLEACAALKNFYAIGVGAAYGRVERTAAVQAHNPAASMFAQAVREMARLVDILGGDADSAYGLPGVGDLYVTTMAGRNSRLGRLLGTGIPYRQARSEHMAGETVEGADLAEAVGYEISRLMQHGESAGVRFPLTRALLAAIREDVDLDLPWSDS